MDGHDFDTLTRRLATGTSRRAFLTGLAGGSIAGVLAALRPRHGLADDKVLICHLTGSATNPVVLIEVSLNAIPEHEAHGDTIDPDFSSDLAHCGVCGNACDPGERCVAGACEESCGGIDEECCADLSCDPGLTCAEAGTACRDCGEVDEPCCITFATLFCNEGAVCADVGGGQRQCVGCDVDMEDCAPAGND